MLLAEFESDHPPAYVDPRFHFGTTALPALPSTNNDNFDTLVATSRPPDAAPLRKPTPKKLPAASPPNSTASASADEPPASNPAPAAKPKPKKGLARPPAPKKTISVVTEKVKVPVDKGQAARKKAEKAEEDRRAAAVAKELDAERKRKEKNAKAKATRERNKAEKAAAKAAKAAEEAVGGDKGKGTSAAVDGLPRRSGRGAAAAKPAPKPAPARKLTAKERKKLDRAKEAALAVDDDRLASEEAEELTAVVDQPTTRKRSARAAALDKLDKSKTARAVGKKRAKVVDDEGEEQEEREEEGEEREGEDEDLDSGVDEPEPSDKDDSDDDNQGPPGGAGRVAEGEEEGEEEEEDEAGGEGEDEEDAEMEDEDAPAAEEEDDGEEDQDKGPDFVPDPDDEHERDMEVSELSGLLSDGEGVRSDSDEERPLEERLRKKRAPKRVVAKEAEEAEVDDITPEMTALERWIDKKEAEWTSQGIVFAPDLDEYGNEDGDDFIDDSDQSINPEAGKVTRGMYRPTPYEERTVS